MLDSQSEGIRQETSTHSFQYAATDKSQRIHYLEPEEEYLLAKQWREEKDEKALHQLVNSYHRLAVSTASKYRRYRVEWDDLEQEAQIGLMKAAEKFDPYKGVRFSTYAVWWIKAALQEKVMRDSSIVRAGKTAGQKKAFFNQRRVEMQLQREFPELNGDDFDAAVASHLGIGIKDVLLMRQSLQGNVSLNAPQNGNDGETRELIDSIPCDSPNAEETLSARDAFDKNRQMLVEAMSSVLDEREKDILTRRRLKEKPETLEAIGYDYGVSKERIRQLENAAFKKLQKRMLNTAPGF